MEEFDVIVIGAGPHALATVSALMESFEDNQSEVPWNTALFKYSSGRYLYKLKTHCTCSVRRRDGDIWQAMKKSKRKSALRVAVVDADGDKGWLWAWKKQMRALGITHLRSTIHAHPDPVDVEALRVWAHRKKRSVETKEIPISKDEAYHGPFHVPSVKLFEDFCDSIVQRYQLDKILHHRRVCRVIPLIDSNSTVSQFRLEFERHASWTTKRVVFACGSLGDPTMPKWAETHIEKRLPNLSHFTHLLRQTSELDSRAVKGKRIVVVGGGLTAAQLAVRACKEGAAKVTLVARRDVQERSFDLPLAWMGGQRSKLVSEFWSLDGEDGLDLKTQKLKTVKNGGSVTPELMSVLRDLQARGKLCVLERVQVETTHWDEAQHVWEVSFDCEPSQNHHQRYETYDKIWLATGFSGGVSKNPLFADLKTICPPSLHNDNLVLDECLRWRSDVEAYVVGPHAALQLGPGAINLIGARAAAKRVQRGIRMAK